MNPLRVPTYQCPECYVLLTADLDVKNKNKLDPMDDFIVFKHTSITPKNCSYNGFQISIPLYKYIVQDFKNV